tara:strand:- start:3229 stop:3558 length:330 start_codon:yes stop_codon:yes gene_type:complete
MKKIILLFLLLPVFGFSQIKVIQFNAGWNSANKVKWCTSKQLTDCKVSYVDVGEDPKAQKKHSVVVVPTIIIFYNDEEVKRFQADLSFKMVATKEEVQEEIDNQLMSDF